MSVKSILQARKSELLTNLAWLADRYDFWYTSTKSHDLRSIVDEIEEIEKELLK